ncbi:MAG: hypothetical protein WAQ05_07215 [Rubrivivax sp.]
MQHLGRRDALTTWFEHEFTETHAAVGLCGLGIFSSRNDSQRFAWGRGFADMASRAAGPAALCGGPVWAAHRNAANATMLDSDDVLLRPLTPWPEPGSTRGDCRLETEPAENKPPRLPVRSGETVVVGLERQPLQLPPLRLQRLAGACRTAAMRAFDPASRSWSIWWLDGRHPGHIGIPVVGRFETGVGELYADEVIAGRPVRVRFRWSGTDTPAPRGEPAFSPHGGHARETNREMQFSRLP